MTIDEIVKILQEEADVIWGENPNGESRFNSSFAKHFELGKALLEATNALERLKWYESQDLIQRSDSIKTVQSVNYKIPTYMAKVQAVYRIEMLPKAEPPKE